MDSQTLNEQMILQNFVPQKLERSSASLILLSKERWISHEPV
jgi:hypothetical protein